MTDKELLELAAKAAGYKYFHDGYDEILDEPCIEVDGFPWVWMPLRDDDAALRLAVDLRMDVSHWADDAVTAHCLESKPVQEDYGSDPYAATRRAIVRAAAELGSRSNAAVTRRQERDV
jgi:hypothetical protein